MPTILELVRKRIVVNMIRAVQPASRWKIIVVDQKALKILNITCKMHEILEENVTLVEDLTKRRTPYPTTEAIYFITPTSESVNALIEDFTKPKPMYAAAHVFFTSALSDRQFEKIKKAPVSHYFKALKELLVDFLAYEHQAFTFDSPNSIFPLFNPSSTSAMTFELELLAKQMVSVLATLGEYPNIRFYDPSGSNLSLSARFAQHVQAELDNLCRLDPDYPPSGPFKDQRAILLIMDRTLDVISPLAHEFTYQAMMNDLLVIEGGKYVYKAEGGASTDASASQTQTAQLDESDSIWMLIRHWHYADAVEYIRSTFNKFLSENKAAAAALGQIGENVAFDNLKNMKDTLSALPQFQEMKTKFSVHINICQECKQLFERRKLDKIAAVEQDLATGLTADGKPSKNVMTDMVPVLDDPSIVPYDKLRLLMIYIASQEGIHDADRRRLLECAKLSLEDAQGITNLSFMGVRLSATAEKKKENKGRYTYYGHNNSKKKAKTEEEELYVLSRFKPIVKYVIEDQITNDLDRNVFPWLKEPAPEEALSPVSPAGKKPVATNKLIGGGATSLRTTRPTWAPKKGTKNHNDGNHDDSEKESSAKDASSSEDLRKNGPRVIVFMLGGITFSEIRVVYEMIKKHSREVIIGSNHILNPTQFIESLKEIHKPDARLSANTSVANMGSGTLGRRESVASISGASASIQGKDKKVGDKFRGMFKGKEKGEKGEKM
ncbi:Sec1-like protein [Cladochytrium replicatum]|nr:Sec1-like protein [Cladochytrium replicatum]